MRRPRVVIRAFTRRRDVASACLLAELLNALGCDALVTCTRDFMRTVRWWKPEVIVFNSRSYSDKVKPSFPDIKLILHDGEGLIPRNDSLAKHFSDNPDQFKDIDKILIWGPIEYNEMAGVFSAAEMQKIHIVGNPNLDLVKYMPARAKYNPDSKSIGIVTRFHSINNHAGESALHRLPVRANIEDTIAQCKNFVGLINAMRVLLEKTDFSFEIRPHPLEQVESYREYSKHWFGSRHAKRVTVDDRLSFSQFAVRHRALLSPITTSFVKAYLLKVPVINMDILCGTTDHNLEADLGDNWVGASLRPRTEDELVKLVTGDLAPVGKDEQMEQQLTEYCDYYAQESASLRAAKIIAGVAKKARAPRGIRYPTWLVDAMDAISFRRAMRQNPLHHNMNYRRGYHQPPEFLDEMVRQIMGGATVAAQRSEFAA